MVDEEVINIRINTFGWFRIYVHADIVQQPEDRWNC